MLKIPVSRLDELFAAVAKGRALYIPVDNSAGLAEFRRWAPGVRASEAPNTARSAKDFFFPQTENIVGFKMEGKNIEVVETRSETGDFVVFGARACDAASFGLLDRVFLADPVDSFYKSRRERGVIVTLACERPQATCFCTLFGIDPAGPAGDATAWKAGGHVYLEANTDKGRALLDTLHGALEPADDAESAAAVKAQRAETAAIAAKLPLAKAKLDRFTGDNLLALFNSPKWASLSEACLGCGTCTFVCPTCQCYDIRDFDTGRGVRRFRCWDSCMYSDFTKMAHGNPRLTQVERFRQRFMHKLVYYPSNNGGAYGCVGCGRCVSKCPVSMNIVKVMRALGEEN